eukprot:gnl/MRDRNA2_/MRDRNA2_76462_c1_seq1.p1 gnl/MRDRNA2_/MRDRNA2_76462_c1~~gnl/MRDRNA2_/MRDRNA2_76462_c1_seq1.p1  ORF type:complete len:771 (+),score=136.46 gnl/MRDRNA2_/MRDRNA2_76462_c1_seq1:85-2313(+)
MPAGEAQNCPGSNGEEGIQSLFERLQEQNKYLQMLAFERECLEFNLNFEKLSGQMLGIRTLHEGSARRISAISPDGLIARMNQADPLKAVMVGDCIVSVNGVCGDGESIAEELQKVGTFNVLVKGAGMQDIISSIKELADYSRNLETLIFDRASMEVNLEVEKSSQQPLGIKTLRNGNTLRISAISSDGIVDRWNKANSSKVLMVGDYITGVNGITDDGPRMAKELERFGTLNIQVRGASAEDMVQTIKSLAQENRNLHHLLSHQQDEEHANSLQTHMVDVAGRRIECSDSISEKNAQLILRMQDLEKKNRELISDKESNEQTIELLEVEMQELFEKLNGLQSKRSHAGTAKDVQKANQDLKLKASTLENENNDLQNKVKCLEEQVIQLQANVRERHEEKMRLIDSLSSTENQHKSEKAQLLDKVAELEKSMLEQDFKLEQAEERIRKQQQYLNDLESKNEAALAEVRNLEETNRFIITEKEATVKGVQTAGGAVQSDVKAHDKTRRQVCDDNVRVFTRQEPNSFAVSPGRTQMKSASSRTPERLQNYVRILNEPGMQRASSEGQLPDTQASSAPCSGRGDETSIALSNSMLVSQCGSSDIFISPRNAKKMRVTPFSNFGIDRDRSVTGRALPSTESPSSIGSGRQSQGGSSAHSTTRHKSQSPSKIDATTAVMRPRQVTPKSTLSRRDVGAWTPNKSKTNSPNVSARTEGHSSPSMGSARGHPQDDKSLNSQRIQTRPGRQ